MGDGLLGERTERKTQNLVLATLLRPQTTLFEKQGTFGFCTIAEIQLACKLKLDELDNACVLRKTIVKLLEKRFATLGLETQTNLSVLLKNVLKRIVLRDDTLSIEGMHIGHLESVRKTLHKNLLRDTLHTNTDFLIRGEIREVLGSAIRDPLLQRLTKVSRPSPDGELTDDLLILLLAKDTPHTAILAHRSLEATHPRLKRSLLESCRISRQPRTNCRLENFRIARRHERRVARTNATRTIHEKHRKHRSLELRLHQNTIIIAILENPEVVRRNELLDIGLEIGVNVTGTCGILAALKTSPKLSLRNEPRKIVGTHEVLCHADNGFIERSLAVMLSRMLRHLSRKLSHTDLCREITLEGSLQNLTLRSLETVHHRRNTAFQIVVGEVDEILVHKLFVRKRLACGNHGIRILSTKPFLAVIRTRLIKCQIDGGITFGSVGERHLFETLEVFLGLVASGRTQSLVVLDLPALPRGLLPVLLLHDILER